MLARGGPLITHQRFFNGYRPRFLFVFLKVCAVMAPEHRDVLAQREACLVFYDQLFLTAPEEPLEAIDATVLALEEAGINLSVVLAKCYALMTVEFAKYALHGGDVLSAVHGLTGLLQGSLALLGDVDFDASGEVAETSEAAIARLLREHVHTPLTLEGHYKGLPFSQEAILLEGAGDGVVQLHLAQGSKNLLTRDEVVRLTAPFLPRPVGARVAAVDDGQHDVTLHELRFAEHTVRPRSSVRVQPAEPIAIEVARRETLLYGAVVDISVGGLSVLFDDEAPLHQEEWVILHFRLPRTGGEEGHLIEAQAEVVNAIERQGRKRFGLRMVTGAQEEEQISEYISQRQTEVLRLVQTEEAQAPVPRSRKRAGEERRERVRNAIAMVVIIAAVIAIVAMLVRGDQFSTYYWQRSAEVIVKSRECDNLERIYEKLPTANNKVNLTICKKDLRALRNR